MFDSLIRLIFWCIHLALEIRYRIGLCWKILVEITMGMYYKEPGSVELKNKTKHFQKLPKHMGFIVDSTQIDYKKLARIICWSAALGIHFLTIFDGQGILKANQEKLNIAVDLESKFYFDEMNAYYNIKFQKSPIIESSELNSAPNCTNPLQETAKDSCAMNGANMHSEANTTKKHNINNNGIKRRSKKDDEVDPDQDPFDSEAQSDDAGPHTTAPCNSCQECQIKASTDVACEAEPISECRQAKDLHNEHVTVAEEQVKHVINGQTNSKNPYVKLVDADMDRGDTPHQHDYYVTTADWSDGRARIVQLTKMLAQQSEQKSFTPGAIHRALMTRDDMCWPLPDFIMKFDHHEVMSGFMPWHLRYAEILYVGDMKWFNFHSYYNALSKYAKCEQRFGK
jgi:undecaprenyl pyrophosphate synthase